MIQLLQESADVVSRIEERWWMLERNSIHAKIYKCHRGRWKGMFGVNAHMHQRRGGGIATSGPPNLEALHWADDLETAVKNALECLGYVE